MTSPLTSADYDAIASAVMETSRGRWFLAEYARRNRQADTETLLSAIERLERVMRTDAATSAERMRAGLVDMAEAIAKAKAEIAALKPEGTAGRIEEATEELDSVVHTTEAATSDILAAAEHIQEIAWTMREQGLDAEHCDALDSRATDIYTACSFQDLTGQRTRKVIQVLRYLETRIAAMVAAWDGKLPQAVESADMPVRNPLLNGPAKPGQGLEQADVDAVMSPAASAASPLPAVEPAPSVAAAAEPEAAPMQHDPLAPLAAMSYEEKVALFT